MSAQLLFVYTIGAFGLAYIVGHSEITLYFRATWGASRRALDVFRCNVCVAENALDAPQSFEWPRYKLPLPATPTCPNDPKHAAGFVQIETAEDPFLLRLIECPACFGFWIGLFAGCVYGLLVSETPYGLTRLGFAAVVPPLTAVYTSGTNYLLGRLAGLIPNPNSKE